MRTDKTICTCCGTVTDTLTDDGCCLVCEGWWLEIELARIDATREGACELIDATMGWDALFERLRANRVRRGVGEPS